MKNVLYSETIQIPIGNKLLTGELVLPENSESIVLFSHGSGSSRFSFKNRFVAKKLQERNIGTLLFDLLTPDEDRNPVNRTNLPFLTKRLILATEFIQNNPITEDLKLAYFGSGVGAATALATAADFGYLVRAIVCRGARLDLVLSILPDVKAATFLLVGSLDKQVLRSNNEGYQELKCVKELKIIEGASHLFEEPGKMNEVAESTVSWMDKHLKS